MNSTANNAKLRIGLVTDSLEFPAWVCHMLEKVKESGSAEFALILHTNEEARQLPPLVKVLKYRRSLLYLLYRKFDRTLFKVRPDAFQKGQCLNSLLKDVPIITLKGREGFGLNGDAPEELRALQSRPLDLLVRVGSPILHKDLFKIAHCGLWSLVHGDPETQRGSPPGVWEVFQGQTSLGSALEMITGDSGPGVVLAKTHSCTDWISVNRTLKSCYWKSLALLPRQLNELKRLGREDFVKRARARNPTVNIYSKASKPSPNNRQMIRIGARIAGRFLRRKWADFWTLSQWQLLVRQGNAPVFSMHEFERLAPPRDKFWADPHLVVHQGKPYLFFEECRMNEIVGHISVLRLDEHGRWIPKPEIVLKRPYHLSYPFVFSWNGTYYMIPETSENRTIELYRCVEFPGKWELEKTLISNMIAVDATLHERGGRWWMFANVMERDGASSWDELHLFSADHPLSTEWTPHIANPIVSDVRSARPAGPIFQHEGRWIRPAQDCSGHYGRGLKFFEILQLSDTEYKEREISAVYPDWDPDVMAVHSYSQAGGWLAADAMYRRPRWWGE